MNRNGIRIGTGKIYSGVESMEEVKSSIVIGYINKNHVYRIIRFVELNNGITMNSAIKNKIKN